MSRARLSARSTAAALEWRPFFLRFTKGMSDEAHFPAQQSRPRTSARVPVPHGDPGRSQGAEQPSRQGPQQAQRVSVIRKRADFLAANSGKRAATPGFVLLVHDRKDGDPAKRVGFTVTKKIGGAVVRNRMKRRLRALAREFVSDLGQAGADHVLIGRKTGIERDFSAMRREMESALKRIAGQ